MNGIINLMKPPGMTSHDAVAIVRRLLRTRRVGHTGTLDPDTVGVLPIAVGKATRLVQWMQQADKSYRAEMVLGVTTDTYDASGETIDIVTDFRVSPAKLVDVMQMQLGHIMQTPPMYSSVKIDGERLYKKARRGEVVDRPARAVRIDHLKIARIWPDDSLDLEFGARVLFDVTCSKGTYIRSLIHDIGQQIGCGAHMTNLVRTASVPFDLGDSVTFEQIEAAVTENRLRDVLMPMDAGIPSMPAFRLPREAMDRVRHGQTVTIAADDDDVFTHEWARLYDENDCFIAVAKQLRDGAHTVLQPNVVLFPAGEECSHAGS